MFSYDNNVKDKKLFIKISVEVKYNFQFLNDITELIHKVENSSCEIVYITHYFLWLKRKIYLLVVACLR